MYCRYLQLNADSLSECLTVALYNFIFPAVKCILITLFGRNIPRTLMISSHGLDLLLPERSISQWSILYSLIQKNLILNSTRVVHGSFGRTRFFIQYLDDAEFTSTFATFLAMGSSTSCLRLLPTPKAVLRGRKFKIGWGRDYFSGRLWWPVDFCKEFSIEQH